MKINLPFLILFIMPLAAVMGISAYQNFYWAGAKEGTANLENVIVSKARQFNPGDVRKASVTEINITFTDDKGQSHQIQQLSPLTKYFFNYGDTLTIRYFNEPGFEGTIWNFSIKFYYIIIVGGYLILSAVMVYLTSLKSKKKCG